MSDSRGAAIVGAGPNGLAAAVTLARAGVPVTVFEAAATIGGGTRTTESVMPGVLHDVCSAIHPLALASPFFREFELERRVVLAVPEASYANPLDARGAGSGNGSRAAIAFRDLDRTASELGRDGAAYRRLYAPTLRRMAGAVDFAWGGSMLRMPSDPLAALAVGMRTLEQGTRLGGLRFREEAAPALVAGAAAHSIGPMPRLATSAVGLMLGALGHDRGWPVPVGGSRAIADALLADLVAYGGRVVTDHVVDDVRSLSDFDAVLFDTSAPAMGRIAASRLPASYRRKLSRFKFGDAATKVDFVLDGPIPWVDERVALSPTVHLGGSRAETWAAEAAVAKGEHPASPYVLLAQPTTWDEARNPAGRHAIWSYTHVPAGSTLDLTERVTAQIERFAPGFRDRIVAVKTTTAASLAAYNQNYVGGDFSAGAVNLRQLIARPTLSAAPWRTPARGLYLCSSATAPGPGVHGLSGWYAAKAALNEVFGLAEPKLGL